MNFDGGACRRDHGGEGHPRGSEHGRIATLSTEPLTGRTTLDARGLALAPGFIDLHQHGQDPADYRLKALDGYTSVLELEVGTADLDAWYSRPVPRHVLLPRPHPYPCCQIPLRPKTLLAN